MIRSARTSKALLSWMGSLTILMALAMPVGADQIPSAPEPEEVSPVAAPAPAEVAAPAAERSAALRGQLQALGLTSAEIDARVAQLSAGDVNALAASLDQNQVAGIPGFIFPVTIISLVVLGIVLLFLETSTQKKLQ